MNPSINILVAGASGYIGKSLIPRLLGRFPEAQITALSRSAQVSEDPRVQWMPCDLFSQKSIAEALPHRLDLAFYLVHSMGPTAQLDQGSFADYDLILAENFSEALKHKQVKQVVYLGGLIPEDKELSLHLQSRLEVEETFALHKLPTTVFRAGLILGEGGSSFQILLKLVKRLPVMVCPAWTQTLTTPVDLPTVLSALTDASLEKRHIGKTYDLAGCQPLTYLHMMRETARKLGLKRYFLTVPFFTPTLSRLWVTLITNTSKGLVYPLIQSLEHAMVARPSHQFSTSWADQDYFGLLDKASMKTFAGRSLFRFRIRRNTVRSVQRITLGPSQDAASVSTSYFSWLERFGAPFLRVRREGEIIRLSLLKSRIVLIEMKHSTERSTPKRQLFYLTAGSLVAKNNRGRLEFRTVLNDRFMLIAIHDYKPALPWFVYKYTQAVVHLFVMRKFAKFLNEEHEMS